MQKAEVGVSLTELWWWRLDVVIGSRMVVCGGDGGTTGGGRWWWRGVSGEDLSGEIWKWEKRGSAKNVHLLRFTVVNNDDWLGRWSTVVVVVRPSSVEVEVEGGGRCFVRAVVLVEVGCGDW
ncbi:hypothetical protein L1987_18287 [Smallanthus sonchifolius]|uniref:Uncharacterized protein n=1 Tax=Smallanthus sonchifolius TaxID=185202 RepID=A0ACB9J0C5_9ASTR|nr:hypothetical protein L1987_18287 [Smallanthus sonchifolius]